MYGTDQILTAFEECPRKAFWLKSWKSNKLTATEMLQIGVRAGLIEAIRKDVGEVAGETLYALGANHQLVSKQMNVHEEIVHLASISDAVATCLRKESPWNLSETVALGDGNTWTSDALVDPSGARLRRVLFVSSWNPERHYSVCRGWGSLGAVCAHNIPMQIAIVLLGAHKDGRYHSPWSKGFLHPANRKLRFRKRHDVSSGFKDTWVTCWREDRDEISTSSWLQSMLDDGVLQDSLVMIDLPVPQEKARQRILDLASRKLDQIRKLDTLPDQNLSSCDWPIPCVLRNPCHSGADPNGNYGFVKIT